MAQIHDLKSSLGVASASNSASDVSLPGDCPHPPARSVMEVRTLESYLEDKDKSRHLVMCHIIIYGTDVHLKSSTIPHPSGRQQFSGLENLQ